MIPKLPILNPRPRVSVATDTPLAPSDCVRGTVRQVDPASDESCPGCGGRELVHNDHGLACRFCGSQRVIAVTTPWSASQVSAFKSAWGARIRYGGSLLSAGVL